MLQLKTAVWNKAHLHKFVRRKACDSKISDITFHWLVSNIYFVMYVMYFVKLYPQVRLEYVHIFKNVFSCNYSFTIICVIILNDDI